MGFKEISEGDNELPETASGLGESGQPLPPSGDPPRRVVSVYSTEGPELESISDAPVAIPLIRETSKIPIFRGKEIKGIPNLNQLHANWCGYTATADLLQFYGYDISPVGVFEHLHGPYQQEKEEGSQPSMAPSLGRLGKAGKDLTKEGLRPIYLSEQTYPIVLKRKPNSTPFTLLNDFLEDGRPVILRFPEHYVVAVGHDPRENTYLINNPYGGIQQVRDRDDLERSWAMSEKQNTPTFDARYMMLTFFRNNPAQ